MRCRASAFGKGLLFCATLLAAGFASAELSPEELAKLAQNPVGNLISVPFQGAGAADVPEVTLRIPE